jgi:hypothetical protein
VSQNSFTGEAAARRGSVERFGRVKLQKASFPRFAIHFANPAHEWGPRRRAQARRCRRTGEVGVGAEAATWRRPSDLEASRRRRQLTCRPAWTATVCCRGRAWEGADGRGRRRAAQADGRGRRRRGGGPASGYASEAVAGESWSWRWPVLELDLQPAGGGVHGRGEVDIGAGCRRWLSLPMDANKETSVMGANASG